MNKEICKRCINEQFTVLPWTSADDEQWREGLVYCTSPELDEALVSVGESPPKGCYYALEHLVLGQQNTI